MVTEFWEVAAKEVMLNWFWHKHDNEDEFFLVIKGQLTIKLRDQEVTLSKGEFFIVPAGVEHMPVAAEEAHILFFEPRNVINTGSTESDKKVDNPDRI